MRLPAAYSRVKTLSTEDEYGDYKATPADIGCAVFLHFPPPISSSDFVDLIRSCLCSYLSSI